MRWIVVCAVLAGGCAQGPGALDLVTGGIGLSRRGCRRPGGRPALQHLRAASKFEDTGGDRGLRAVQGGQGDEARRRHALPRRARRGGDRRADPAGRTARPGADYVIYFRVLEIEPAGPVSASALSVDEILLFYGKRFADA